jgi:hypothetical protein
MGVLPDASEQNVHQRLLLQLATNLAAFVTSPMPGLFDLTL